MIELSSNIAEYIRSHFGEDYLNNYINYYNGEYNPYLRISSSVDKSGLINRLKGYSIELETVPNFENVFKIISRKESVGKTLEFILGKYYLQSLSSMIPALALDPRSDESVLDLCAAPGSKTTQLAELMNNSGTLIANEISIERLKSLVFNVDKMNLVNVGILNGKGELLSKQFDNRFDKILVDAPCSALGITQKKGEVSNWWNIKKAESISDLQLRLLIAAIKMCKTGGEIVYSTCTLTLEENELVINKVLEKYPVELIEFDLPVKSVEGFIKFENQNFHDSLSKTRRILPWEIESEGFFIAKLRKIKETESTGKTFRKEKKLEFLNTDNKEIKNYLTILSEYYGIDKSIFNNYKYLIKNNDIHFVNRDWDMSNFESCVRVGARLGAIDKRSILQLNSLAAQILNKSITKNIVELDNTKELEIYLNGGVIKNYFQMSGQKIIKYNNYFIGTAVASKEGLKSQFPRAFRTQQINLQ